NATMEVPAPFAGTITALKAESGQQVKVGDVVLAYTPVGEADEAAAPVAVEGKAAAAKRPAAAHAGDGSKAVPTRPRPNGPSPAGVAVKAAPSVRYMARQLGIDLAAVHGSGPEGRILIGDLSAAVKPGVAEQRPEPKVRFDFGTPGTRIKLQGLRRKIA